MALAARERPARGAVRGGAAALARAARHPGARLSGVHRRSDGRRVSPGTAGRGWPRSAGRSTSPRAGPRAATAVAAAASSSSAHRGLWTLLDYTYRRRWTAESGDHGGPNQETGKSADDVELPVPLGTVVRDADSGELLGEVLADGDRLLVAKGGRGGQGNQHFATPTHQAPHEFQPGEDGERRPHPAHPQAHRRRGAPRRAQRGQEHAPRDGDGGAAQDRRLSVHHARAEPRRRAAQRPPQPS